MIKAKFGVGQVVHDFTHGIPRQITRVLVGGYECLPGNGDSFDIYFFPEGSLRPLTDREIGPRPRKRKRP
jgi:hypothetical protein